MADDLKMVENNVNLLNERFNNFADETSLKTKLQGEVTSSIQTDVKEILKILKGDGYSVPGLVSRVITLENQVRLLSVLVTIVSVTSLVSIIMGIIFWTVNNQKP